MQPQRSGLRHEGAFLPPRSSPASHRRSRGRVQFDPGSVFGGAAVAVAISGLAAGVALSAPAVGIVLGVLGALAGAVMAVAADRRSAAEWQPVPHSIKPAAASRRNDRRSDPRCDC